MPKATALPSWGRVRPILRSLGLPAIPGWLLLAFSLGKEAHFVMSLLEGIGLAGLLREYGWVIGLVWLGALVVWEARKPPRDEELRRAGAMKDLGTGTVDVIRRFEALCLAYEGQEPAVSLSGRRHELLLALESLLKNGLDVMPPAQRAEFKHMLLGVLLDYAQYHDGDQRTRFAENLPPTLAITRALLPTRQQQPEAGPPSSTASG
jgi:hypothetical protein